MAKLLQALFALRRAGRLFRARQRHRSGAGGRCAGRGGDVLGGHLRPGAARVGAQRRPVAGGSVEQRHIQRDDERPAAGVRQAARRRAQSFRDCGGNDRDQRRDRARWTCPWSHRILRAGLPRYADPAEDAAHGRDAIRSGRAGPVGRRRSRGSDRRDDAEWKVRASSPTGDRRRRSRHAVRGGRHRRGTT